jgi:cytochrome c
MMNLHLIALVSALVCFVSRDENHPPVVKITQPKTGSSYAPNSQVRYTISVSDKEDGDSKYQEINTPEVLLQVKYIPNASAAQQNTSLPVHEGLQSILQSNCLNCHAFNAPLLGPSFVDINKKYRSNASATNTLVKHVLEGSTGIWGRGVMPSHPELKPPTAASMVEWIMKNAGDTNISYYTGTEGAVRLVAPSGTNKGAFILSASYRDHGSANSGKPLTGTDNIVLYLQ